MGLLSRTPTPARGKTRTPRPRVRLSQAELRATSQLAPVERKIAWGLAAFTAVFLVVAWVDVGMTSQNKGAIRLAGGIGFAGLLAVAARGRSRFLVGLAAVGNVFFWPAEKDKPLYTLAAYPSLLFMMFLMLRMSNARRKAVEARIARGDTDLPGTEPARPRKRRGAAEATDATGEPSRPVAPPSKRYTPPKHRPAKRR